MIRSIIFSEKRKCKQCGGEFTATHWLKVYCSPTCLRRSQIKRSPSYIPQYGIENCICCGKPFRTPSKNKRICSSCNYGNPQMIVREHSPELINEIATVIRSAISSENKVLVITKILGGEIK